VRQDQRPVRDELNRAVIAGVRERGPEAVGLVIVAAARVLIATVVLALLLTVHSVLGYALTATPYVGITATSSLVSLLLTRRRPRVRG
jgi:hypothetical protein